MNKKVIYFASDVTVGENDRKFAGSVKVFL
jgi:hypothetical protein